MLESYDDDGGCAAAIICLIGLIVFTIGTVRICMSDNGHAYTLDKAHVICECACEHFDYDNKQEDDE